MESGSILETIGQDIIGVMSPVSVCMFLVVLLVYTVYNPSATAPTIRTAANLVYTESPSDSPVQKLEGAILNAVVFVVIITLLTFLLVLLYYYRFTNFLVHYTRFSVFMIFSFMGSSILISIIQRFNIPVDAVTFFILLFNFTILGTISVFSNGVPIIVKQSNLVVLGIIVAAWFTRLPEWTTWVVLVALAMYDLAAVLAPGGPLKMLVELASSRDEELPALVYESRPHVGQSPGPRPSSLGLLVAAADLESIGNDSDRGAVELQVLLRNSGNEHRAETRENEYSIEIMGIRNSSNEDEIDEDRETLPLIRNGVLDASSTQERDHSMAVISTERANLGEIEEERGDLGENFPLMGDRVLRESQSSINDTSSGIDIGRIRDRVEIKEMTERGIKLGMGDFIFYSVLVGRAAMYDLMTVYACYLAIISGLGCTLILLAVFRHALPALPISITLGVMFYFLTRLLMEPFVVGASTNLMMF
ncbi:presenilin-like protein [Dorcoceras hygrometricum]|uniref:Presenilin n=1 Tax=Dorcoceras hygrometricum TaxID=472368 RepID=A0A2Z7CVV2_9LAMI|nr:presenilin-like protein [Dorcoceras hygrometricum]